MQQAKGSKLQEGDTFGISDINPIFNKRVISSHNMTVHQHSNRYSGSQEW
jgi:hypothetical protein